MICFADKLMKQSFAEHIHECNTYWDKLGKDLEKKLTTDIKNEHLNLDKVIDNSNENKQLDQSSVGNQITNR